MCIWTKQNNLLWPLVFLFFLGFSSSIVVCAVQDDAVFVDSDSELPENMKKYMKIDENTITVTLDPDPTKSLLLPLIAKNSPKCLSFNTSQAGGCGNGTKWEVKYPSGLDNCSLVGMWSISERGPELKLSSGKKDVGGLIGSEVVLNIAGDNVILEGVTLPSLSCAVNALRNPDADYAMNLEFTASCSAVLKFDRQKFAIKRLIKKDDRKTLPKVEKSVVSTWMIVGIVIGIVALLAVSVVIFFLVKYIRAKKSQESNVEQGKHVEGADGSKRSMSNSAAFSKSEGVIVVKTCISPTSDEDVQPKSSKKSGAKAISKSQQLSSNAKASAQPSKSKKINTLPEQIPSVSELFPQLSSDKVMKSDNSISGSLVGDIRDQVKETRKKTKRKKLQKEKAPREDRRSKMKSDNLELDKTQETTLEAQSKKKVKAK